MTCIIKPTDLKQFSVKRQNTNQHISVPLTQSRQEVTCASPQHPRGVLRNGRRPALSSEAGFHGEGDLEELKVGAGAGECQVSGQHRSSLRSQALCGGFSVKLAPRNLFTQEPFRLASECSVHASGASLPLCLLKASTVSLSHCLCHSHQSHALPNCSPGKYQERRLFFPTENVKHMKTNCGGSLQST